MIQRTLVSRPQEVSSSMFGPGGRLGREHWIDGGPRPMGKQEKDDKAARRNLDRGLASAVCQQSRGLASLLDHCIDTALAICTSMFDDASMWMRDSAQSQRH
eukprot:8892991-Pyramimonas_sp.AAC.1